MALKLCTNPSKCSNLQNQVNTLQAEKTNLQNQVSSLTDSLNAQKNEEVNLANTIQSILSSIVESNGPAPGSAKTEEATFTIKYGGFAQSMGRTYYAWTITGEKFGTKKVQISIDRDYASNNPKPNIQVSYY